MFIDMDSIIMYQPPLKLPFARNTERGPGSSPFASGDCDPSVPPALPPYEGPSSIESSCSPRRSSLTPPPPNLCVSVSQDIAVKGGDPAQNVTPPWNDFDALLDPCTVSKAGFRDSVDTAAEGVGGEDDEACDGNVQQSQQDTPPAGPLKRYGLSAHAALHHDFSQRGAPESACVDQGRPLACQSQPLSDGAIRHPDLTLSPIEDPEIVAVSEQDGPGPVLSTDHSHNGGTVCCGVSVVIPFKTRADRGRANQELEKSTGEEIRNEDGNNDDGDGIDGAGDFSIEAESFVVLTPPHTESPGPDSTTQKIGHSLNEAICNIPISGELMFHLNGVEPRYTLTFSHVDGSPAPAPQVRGHMLSSGSSRARQTRPKAQARSRKDRFTPQEDALLSKLQAECRPWREVARCFPLRSQGALQVRYSTKLRSRTGRRRDR